MCCRAIRGGNGGLTTARTARTGRASIGRDNIRWGKPVIGLRHTAKRRATDRQTGPTRTFSSYAEYVFRAGPPHLGRCNQIII